MRIIQAYNDSNYIEAIRTNDDKIVSEFYRKVSQMSFKEIQREGVVGEDINEIYQESFCLFIEKVRNENFELTSRLSTFLIGICKNQAKAFQRKTSKFTNTVSILDEEALAMSDYDENDQVKIQTHNREVLFEEFEKLIFNRSKCHTLLKLCYLEGKKNSSVVSIMNMKNEDVVKTQKSRCLEYLRKEIFRRIYNV